MKQILDVLFFFKRMYCPVIIGVICFILVWFYDWLAPLLFICLITVFDIVGWQLLFIPLEILFDENSLQQDVDFYRKAYRIIQKMFEVLCLAVVLSFGWINALMAVLLWLFGLSDGWHYWITKSKLEDHWTFRWMFFGWFQKKIPRWQVITSMCSGVLCYIVYVLLKLLM